MVPLWSSPPSRTLMSSDKMFLVVPNSLPLSIRTTPTVETFKYLLKSHFFSLAFEPSWDIYRHGLYIVYFLVANIVQHFDQLMFFFNVLINILIWLTTNLNLKKTVPWVSTLERTQSSTNHKIHFLRSISLRSLQYIYWSTNVLSLITRLTATSHLKKSFCLFLAQSCSEKAATSWWDFLELSLRVYRECE